MENTAKKYFTKKEALEDIENTLESYSGYYSDLHNETFNTDYYIIGTYEAKKALEQYGTFEAIRKIQEYENDNFGEVLTDLSDPEKIANMLYYIIGNEAINDLYEYSETFSENENDSATAENNDQIIQDINELGLYYKGSEYNG